MSSNAFENALVDKLGKNDIKWEKDGFIDSSKLWLTYEETIDANTQSETFTKQKRSLETEWAVHQRDTTKGILWIW